MREDLPLVSYERSMNHNYMVLGKCDFFGTAADNSKDYRVRMLLENKIQGLLPITYRQVNGESKYYYEINSLQSLDRLIEKNALKYRELRAVFLGCVNLFDRLEEYLLSGEQIIIQPDFIYVNVESMEPHFVCYPDYTGDVRVSFVGFVDVLLAHIDHTDEQAVMLGYQVYRYTRNPNYVLSEIRKFMECPMEHGPEKEGYHNAVQQNTNASEFCFMPEEGIAQKCGESISNYSERNYSQNNYSKSNGSGMSCNENNKNRESYNNRFLSEHCGMNEEDVEQETVRCNKGEKKQLFGGIFCILIALCAGTVAACARTMKLFKLSGEHELYLYGAVAMALVAAALFFVCYIKAVRQRKEIEQLNEDEEDAIYEELIKRDIVNDLTKKEPSYYNDNAKSAPVSVEYARNATIFMGNTSETVCLEGAALEERVLRGNVNGKEVSVSLESLPLTIGKLGGVSDFIINDTAVSKMHARFEEHNGKVCVCDLNSTNGTVHNGKIIAINTPVALESGDTLRFGRSCFTYS